MMYVYHEIWQNYFQPLTISQSNLTVTSKALMQTLSPSHKDDVTEAACQRLVVFTLVYCAPLSLNLKCKKK